jgi:hypothetical protein
MSSDLVWLLIAAIVVVAFLCYGAAVGLARGLDQHAAKLSAQIDKQQHEVTALCATVAALTETIEETSLNEHQRILFRLRRQFHLSERIDVLRMRRLAESASIPLISRSPGAGASASFELFEFQLTKPLPEVNISSPMRISGRRRLPEAALWEPFEFVVGFREATFGEPPSEVRFVSS